jgi:hypothetical protein
MYGCAGSPWRTGLWLFSLLFREETGKIGKPYLSAHLKANFYTKYQIVSTKFPTLVSRENLMNYREAICETTLPNRNRPVVARLFGPLCGCSSLLR